MPMNGSPWVNQCLKNRVLGSDYCSSEVQPPRKLSSPRDAFCYRSHSPVLSPSLTSGTLSGRKNKHTVFRSIASITIVITYSRLYGSVVRPPVVDHYSPLEPRLWLDWRRGFNPDYLIGMLCGSQPQTSLSLMYRSYLCLSQTVYPFRNNTTTSIQLISNVPWDLYNA